jgi:hypothetical protein
VHRRAEVAAGEQFFVEPAGLEAVDVSGQFIAAFGLGEQASATASAASMPDFIAVWLP